MNKRNLAVFMVLAILATAAFVYQRIDSKLIRLTPDLITKLHTAVAAENEAAIDKPVPIARTLQTPNPSNNVYFGDLHVHTAWSFDGYLGGNRVTPAEAYKFAQGEPLTLMSGELAQLSVPLDFAAITDHAESYGLFEGCADPSITEAQADFCKQFDAPSVAVFYKLRQSAVKRPPQRAEFCGSDGEFCIKHGKTTWQKTQAAADAANKPGEFTSFYAYEYSPAWPKGGSTHRNVIFKNREVPELVVSAYDAATALDLWQTLDSSCKFPCEVITIPHNLNRYYGKTFSDKDEDGKTYDESDWKRRQKFEPIVEMFQTKGNSECAIGIGTTDEACRFEQSFPTCAPGETDACAGPNTYARDGLKFGLALETDLGFNPLQFGFIGSTDYHNSNPGDTEEWDYRGKSGIKDASAAKRLDKRNYGHDTPITHNPGGLAAIWAPENTRDALFEGLQRKETYATSGTRIKLRYFGFAGQPKLDLNDQNLITAAYQQGVTMGSSLKGGSTSQPPSFLIWALKDPINANLAKVQMIKGWVENGISKELVFDIKCSDNAQPIDGKCPDNQAKVDLKTCRITNDTGAAELKVLWQDPDFDEKHAAFYYVRIMQNPTCRWSTFDAIRLGIDPIDEMPATIQERAWSSPIWYSPKSDASET